MSSLEKVVKKASKVKFAPPKAKHVNVLIDATRTGDGSVGEIFRVIQYRLADSSWTVVLKALTVVHILIREGYQDVVIRFLARYKHASSTLSTPTITVMSAHGKFILYYVQYLQKRVRFFRDLEWDAVDQRKAKTHISSISIDKGLLRNVEAVQLLAARLQKCQINSIEADEVIMAAYRLVVSDLMTLFQVVNEGVIEILRKYFEMSKYDAERALDIYKHFVSQTEEIYKFFGIARSLEWQTGIKIPDLKHAPTQLTNALEDYLNDKDFDANRRKYLQTKASSSSRQGDTSQQSLSQPLKSALKPSSSTRKKESQTALIDFFDSLDNSAGATSSAGETTAVYQTQNPQNIAQIQQQITGIPLHMQVTGLPIQTQFTGLLQPGTVAPFAAANTLDRRASQLIPAQLIAPQAENPFRHSIHVQQLQQQQLLYLQQQQQLQHQMTGNPYGVTAKLQPQRTGLNPFSNSPVGSSLQQQQQQQQLKPQATGNPFRISNDNQQQQPTFGGLEKLETIPVFPQRNSNLR